MKRKVNKVGPSTLTVSLPTSWVKNQNIAKGDEVSVEISEGTLLISKKVGNLKKTTEIDVSDHKAFLSRIVAAAYKAGYDEIILNYKTPDQLKLIQDAIDRGLWDFDILDYGKSSVRIVSLAYQSPEKYTSVLKRIFHTLESTANSMVEYTKEGLFDELKSVAMRDRSIDKYSDYCRRILNKGSSEVRLVGPHYYIVEQMEIIGDLYRDFCIEIEKQSKAMSKDLIIGCSKVNSQLKMLYPLVFAFSMKSLREFEKLNEESGFFLEQLQSKIPLAEIRYLCILCQISRAIFECKSAILTSVL